MVSEPVIGRRASEDVGSQGGGLWDPTSVGEGNKAFLVRVWKPLPSRRVLRTLRGSPKGKAQGGQHQLAVGLGCYKRYQSQSPGSMPVRTLGPQEGRLWDPTSVGEGNEPFLVRVWKRLLNRRVLETLRGSPKEKAQRGQYLLAVGLGRYILAPPR